MPRIDLSTLTAPELRQLLRLARGRHDGLLIDRVEWEIAQRKALESRVGVDLRRPTATVIEDGDVTFDEVRAFRRPEPGLPPRRPRRVGGHLAAALVGLVTGSALTAGAFASAQDGWRLPTPLPALAQVISAETARAAPRAPPAHPPSGVSDRGSDAVAGVLAPEPFPPSPAPEPPPSLPPTPVPSSRTTPAADAPSEPLGEASTRPAAHEAAPKPTTAKHPEKPRADPAAPKAKGMRKAEAAKPVKGKPISAKAKPKAGAAGGKLATASAPKPKVSTKAAPPTKVKVKAKTKPNVEPKLASKAARKPAASPKATPAQARTKVQAKAAVPKAAAKPKPKVHAAATGEAHDTIAAILERAGAAAR